MATNHPRSFKAFAEKMRSEGLPEIAIANFQRHYQQLMEGQSGFIPEADIQAVKQLTHTNELNEEHATLGAKALGKTVLLKLNGGLGTSMGLERAKSLMPVKDNASFLDIIAQHALQAQVHLLLMNSFNTRDDSFQVLNKYPDLFKNSIDLDFLQHKVPKITRDDYLPAVCDHNAQLEWCPPGHGDIYIALLSSGILDALLDAGYCYALVSNADNLGAVLDTQLLGYFVERECPFLMEVTARTEADKKGGHLALSPEGGFLLRESAQCPEQDKATFENIQTHRYFNTNNLWVDLKKLHATLAENNNVLELPLIRNAKTLDPRDPDSQAVYQLETAMGSAIGIFKGADAICVSRRRFAPVKTTNDLLLVRSDIYQLNDNYTITSELSHTEMPLINLDSRFYKMIDDFEARFPAGAPSLLNCKRLTVVGDIIFNENIRIEGDVTLTNHGKNPVSLAADTIINTDISWD